MRDAAVGFQCPSCVAEGAKTTRSGRTAYGGLRPTNASITSIGLIAVNAAVWLLVMATGGSGSVWAARLSLLPTGRCLLTSSPNQYYPAATEGVCSHLGPTTWVDGVADGAYWQLLTSAFTHVEIWHIAFNMLALYVLGPQLEQMVGRIRFLALYLLSGLVGSLLVYWLSPVDGSTLGASGAVFGLMGALLVVAHKVRADTQQILMWIGVNFVITVVGRGFISWQGHLGGFIGGLLIAGVLVYAPRHNRTLVQAAGLGAIALLVVAGVLLRSGQLTTL